MTGLRRSVAAATLPTVFVSLPLFLTGALGVQLRRDLGIDEAALGLAVGSIPMAGAVCSVFTGRVIHRFGSGVGLRVGAVVGAIAMLGVAGLAEELHTLVVFLALGGLGVAFVYPASDAWIAGHVPMRRQGLAMGVKQAAAPAAALVAGLAVPTFAVTVGWRWAYFAGGLAAVAAALSVPATTAGTLRGVPKKRDGDVPWGPLLLLAGAFALGQIAVLSLVGFGVSSAVDAGIGEASAGVLFAAGSVVGILVRLRAGHLADVRPRNQFMVAAAMLLGGAVCFAVLATGHPVAVVVTTPLAFATGWGWPGLFLLAVMRANRAAPAVASGVMQIGANTGAFVGPLLFGVLAVRSYTLAWSVSAASGVVAAAAMMWAGRHVVRATHRGVLRAEIAGT